MTRTTLGRTVALFVVVQATAVAAGPQLASSGVRYGDGGTALVPLVAGLAVGTAAGLAVGRYGLSPRVVRAVVTGSFTLALWFALAPVAGRLAGSLTAGLLGGVGALAGTWLLARSDRRTVRNAVTAVATGGVAAVFGGSLTPPFAVLAAVAVTGYDIIAVYVTGHMQQLAAVGQRLDLPTVFVVGGSDAVESRHAATRRATDDSSGSETVGSTDETRTGESSDRVRTSESGDRVRTTDDTRLVVGAGDALFPAILTASVATHLPATAVFEQIIAPAMGGVVGLLALQWVVARDGTHAGLPFVVGGSLVGWLMTVV